MLVDTHAHVHFPEFAGHVDAVVERAKQSGVGKIITVGVNIDDSAAAVAMAERFDHVYATLGLHPHDAEFDHPAEAIRGLRVLATHPKVVAIGECGLDYSRPGKGRYEQEGVFRAQIELAIEHDLPMVWHVRDAFPDFFEIIDDYPDVRGIMHCFTSTRADIEQAVSRGFYIALNGIMTFTKLDWQLEAARAVPLDRLVLETDCPYLAPVPLRGRVNEPAYMAHTAEFLASLRDESLAAIEYATSNNAIRLLRLG